MRRRRNGALQKTKMVHDQKVGVLKAIFHFILCIYDTVYI